MRLYFMMLLQAELKNFKLLPDSAESVPDSTMILYHDVDIVDYINS